MSKATSPENPYQKILGVLGVALVWICLSSLLHERYSADLKLPLDPFGSESRGSVLIWGMLVCWPLFALVNVIGWRLAISMKGETAWNRLAQPFGLGEGMMTTDRKVYAAVCGILFHVLPYVHVCQFAGRFFFVEESQPIWVWTGKAWFRGMHDYYLGTFYYGWFPVLFLLCLFGVLASSATLLGAIFAPVEAQTPEKRHAA